MPSIDLYVNYGVHGVRDCSRPAMAMDGIQYLREVRGRPPPVESVGLLTGGPDRRRPGSIYTAVTRATFNLSGRKPHWERLRRLILIMDMVHGD